MRIFAVKVSLFLIFTIISTAAFAQDDPAGLKQKIENIMKIDIWNTDVYPHS